MLQWFNESITSISPLFMLDIDRGPPLLHHRVFVYYRVTGDEHNPWIFTFRIVFVIAGHLESCVLFSLHGSPFLTLNSLN